MRGVPSAHKRILEQGTTSLLRSVADAPDLLGNMDKWRSIQFLWTAAKDRIKIIHQCKTLVCDGVKIIHQIIGNHNIGIINNSVI